MELTLIIILTTVGGLILYFVQSLAVQAPGASLNKKFVSLGHLPGKTLQEITVVAGAPSAVSAVGNGQILRQWQATSYHIALLFDENDICLGINSEISV